ncbi:MAG TPA: hypothetical protein VMW48_07975 [Vicinamibacterales bacterium]|nr:hypothetical protein [Vicinamibacterales bacterium]
MRMTMTVLFMALVISAPAVRALTVLPATFEELVRESAAVVHGRVRSVHAAWTTDRRTIQSTVTLDVADAFKGTATATATFVVPGGEAGGRILVVPGAPVFRAGDEVVVFLRGRAPLLPEPVGLSLGVYRVSTAAAPGTSMVVPSPIHATAAPARVARGSSARRVRSLAAFAADVRAVGAAR